MAIPDNIAAIITRFTAGKPAGYNDDPYNASTNPFGFAAGGHRHNLYPVGSDMTALADWLATEFLPILDLTEQIEALNAISATLISLDGIKDEIVALDAIKAQMLDLHEVIGAIAIAAANIAVIEAVAENVEAVISVDANMAAILAVEGQAEVAAGAAGAAIAALSDALSLYGNITAINNAVSTSTIQAGIASDKAAEAAGSALALDAAVEAYRVDPASLSPVLPTLDLIFNSPSAIQPSWFTRASTATYFDANGVMRFAAINELRIDHDPATGECLGALIEGQSTNKVTARKHNPIDLTSMAKTPPSHVGSVLSVVDDTAELAKAGLSNICTNGKVYKLDNTAGASNVYAVLSGALGTTAGHALSVYVRGTGGDGFLSLRTDATAGTSYPIPVGYQRLSNVRVAPAATEVPWLRCGIGAILYFILPQVEEGAAVTSVIPGDTTAQVTRAADYLSVPAPDWVRQNGEGTVYAEFVTGGRTSGMTVFSLHVGASENDAHRARGAGNGRFQTVTNQGGVAQTNMTDPELIEAYTRYSLATAWAVNDFAVSYDGDEVATDSTGALPNGTFSDLSVGSANSASESLGGHMKRIAYFPKHLPNPTLPAMSAP